MDRCLSFGRAPQLGLSAHVTAPFYAPTPTTIISLRWRAQVQPFLDPVLSHKHVFQCGGLKARCTDIATLVVRSIVFTRQVRSVYGAGISVDLVSAFYPVILEYIMPCIYNTIALHIFLPNWAWKLRLSTSLPSCLLSQLRSRLPRCLRCCS